MGSGARSLARGSTEEARAHLTHALSLLTQAPDDTMPESERHQLARKIGADLMACHVRSEDYLVALETAQSLLGPGGLLAGTDPSANYKILLGRANALACLSRHSEARTAFNSVFRLLGESLASASALEARFGALLATRHIDGVAQAQEQLGRMLNDLDMSIRAKPDVAPVVSRIEAELSAMQATLPGSETAQS